MIFLNGTSSSGKSSLAAELLRTLDSNYFHLSVDAFNAMGARRADLFRTPDELATALTRMRQGFHRAIAGMAAGGNNVVVDHVFSERWRLLDCLDVLAGYDVVLVGVRCSLDELRRRELARGDRSPGTAEYQYDRVHSHGVYDVECDTGTTSTEDCARLVRDFLARRDRTVPTAFDRLRELDLGVLLAESTPA
ncbi:AAA family ATPase [Kitasatospora sp. MAP5-34]|uniref:chloramphenicol phosphotransferase CPT family protein n=1 Tax=Kitasatospora sp. MAP5-34 TaxID=3035102 RepID=UPI002473A8AB|nr:AAA family ATPase [Kitasatospora sp. MAP5-34]